MLTRRSLLAAVSCTAALPAAIAQNRPMRLIVPFPAGGATDVLARSLADPLSRELGAPVVVENRSGAGGSLGTAEVAKAAPDGLTLGLATLSTHAVNPVAYRKLPYNPATDFSYISEVARAPVCLVVNPRLPVNTVAELAQHLKRNPGKLTYGSPGVGSAGHFYTEIFKSQTGTFVLHVPYRGAAGVVTDLIGGQIDLSIDQVASVLPHIQAGRMRALAVAWHTRLPLLPNTPTFAETGQYANNQPSWFGLVGPAGMRSEQVSGLNAAVRKVLRDQELGARLARLGLFPHGSEPAEFATSVAKEIKSLARVAEVAKIALD